jgi:hypothetical protein
MDGWRATRGPQAGNAPGRPGQWPDRTRLVEEASHRHPGPACRGPAPIALCVPFKGLLPEGVRRAGGGAQVDNAYPGKGVGAARAEPLWTSHKSA